MNESILEEGAAQTKIEFSLDHRPVKVCFVFEMNDEHGGIKYRSVLTPENSHWGIKNSDIGGASRYG